MNRPMKRCVLAVLVTVAAGFVASCESSAPTAPATTGAGAPTFSLSGRVVDNASVPIPGALVAIVGDGGAESSTLTDGGGRYELRGLPGGAVTMRASKEAYVASTTNIQLPRTSPLDFILDFTGPSFDLAGTYTVTFTADAACTQLPEGTRTRTYSASVTPYFPQQLLRQPERRAVSQQPGCEVTASRRSPAARQVSRPSIRL